MNLTCPDCKKAYPTLNALRCHITREKNKPDILKCINKRRQKEYKIKEQEDKIKEKLKYIGVCKCFSS